MSRQREQKRPRPRTPNAEGHQSSAATATTEPAGLSEDLAEMPAMLTIPEVAKLLRISRGAAYMAARRGEIPCFRIGRTLRVSRAAMVTWLCQGGVSRSGSDP